MNSYTQMNYRLLAVTGLVLVTSFLFAQGRQRPEGPPPVPDADQIVQMVNNLEKELGLTGEQKDALLKLHMDHFSMMKSHQGQNGQKPSRDRSQMDNRRLEFEKQVKALLTYDQQQKFEQLMKNHRSERKTIGRGHR